VADPRLSELAGAVQALRERVAARHPSTAVVRTPLALVDLTPLLHARDAAESKVAAIGVVNPRPPGLLNNLIQSVKHRISRSLQWFVREQVEFNRAALNCVQSSLDALNDFNRLAVDLSFRIDSLQHRLDGCEQQAAALADVHSHWIEWRREWEHKLATNEVQFLRAIADLETAYQQRTHQSEAAVRETVTSQHRAFEAALERTTVDIQKQMWNDLERIRTEYERLIHGELRTLRQRAATLAPTALAPAIQPPTGAPAIDALHFSLRFRGPEEYVRDSFQAYVPEFTGRRNVLDIGCGRGEFLELARDAGIIASGIDLSSESVALCRSKGLAALEADLFTHLASLPDASLDGIFCAQVVEHLPPDRIPEFVALAALKLARDGCILIETPNPECLAIFATHFYLDPTHTRPIPPPLLAFYLEEAGFGRIETRYSHPAVDSMPSLATLPESFRNAFFNALDYAILARRL
jgi:2-polyprenyl-3-methyl-5-hydroxy-6-metoxy-1,4-benzoquinol methylase